MSTPAIPQDLQLNPSQRTQSAFRGEARGGGSGASRTVDRLPEGPGRLQGRDGSGKAVRAAGPQTAFPRPQPRYGCVRSPHGALASRGRVLGVYELDNRSGARCVLLVYGLNALRAVETRWRGRRASGERIRLAGGDVGASVLGSGPAGAGLPWGLDSPLGSVIGCPRGCRA